MHCSPSSLHCVPNPFAPHHHQSAIHRHNTAVCSFHRRHVLSVACGAEPTSSKETQVRNLSAAGLVGHNFLNLLEMAKKNVLQPGAAVVPCAASLYVMGIHVPPVHVGKYDLSGLDKYRSEAACTTC